MKTRAIITGGALVAAAFALAASQAVALKRNPVVGETTSYTMKIDLSVQGQEIQVSFDSTSKVTKVDPDGSFVVTEENTNQVVMMGGQEISGAGSDETVTMTYAATGAVKLIEASVSSSDQYRLSNLTTVIWPTKPIDVGSKWEATLPQDAAKGSLEVNHSYEVLARETVLGLETFKIKFEVKETSGDASGAATTWIEVKTGNVVKSTGELKNAPIQGIPMDAKYTLEMKK